MTDSKKVAQNTKIFVTKIFSSSFFFQVKTSLSTELMANLKDMDFAVQLTNEACLLGEPDYLVRLDENKAVANYRSFFNRDEAVFKNGKISNHKVFFC